MSDTARQFSQVGQTVSFGWRIEKAAPELLATAPNQLWSWDITKLRGPIPWTYYYLYVILDVFSRAVVGWLIKACRNQ